MIVPRITTLLLYLSILFPQLLCETIRNTQVTSPLHHQASAAEKEEETIPIENELNSFIPNTKDYQIYHEDINELENLLFPNHTQTYFQHHWNQFRRNLGIVKQPYSGSVPCTTCQGLQNCPALNSFMVQEVYYPSNTALRETCTVLDELGARMAATIFGLGRTFRDTPQCRLMVMQYLCLFWGTNNPMYTNYCVYQESVLPDGELSVAPRPPCKSFCVQVAGVCAYDPDYFIQSCNNIACPPTKDQCTPDPELDGKVLAANLGCAVPYYSSPYFRTNASNRWIDLSQQCWSSIVVIFVLTTLVWWW